MIERTEMRSILRGGGLEFYHEEDMVITNEFCLFPSFVTVLTQNEENAFLM